MALKWIMFKASYKVSVPIYEHTKGNCALWRSKTKTMQSHTRELSGSVTLMDSVIVSD